MKFTARFAHLASALVGVGDTIVEGAAIGVMGSSGQSSAAHLHIDCVEGEALFKYTQGDIEKGIPKPALRQLNYFIDDALFKTTPLITTFVADYNYQQEHKKVHFGYDVVPFNRRITTDNFTIYWNRSMVGRVSKILDDPAGYGNCVYVVFDV